MNLSKLFELQKAIDAPYSDVEDRLSKDILWLMEELGELIREWRGHKYRRPSEEQKPRTRLFPESNVQPTSFTYRNINPLLEEYTDCLSIILSIGLQHDKTDEKIFKGLEWILDKRLCTTSYIENQIKTVMKYSLELTTPYWYRTVVHEFVDLGFKFGFTWDQIEENYIAKVEVNKQRNC